MAHLLLDNLQKFDEPSGSRSYADAMKDVETETKLRLISLQLESWKKLHDLVTYGLDKAKPIISRNRTAI